MRILMQTAPRHRQAGFNLIEVTLAVAVAAIGLLAVFGLLAGGIGASRQVSDETLITHLMDDMHAWSPDHSLR
jgi:prepilin-type N-terminal cleavage/methylation domain